MFERYQQFCASRQITGNHRQLPGPFASGVMPLLDFSSNDYLGLSRHPALLQAAVRVAQTHGVGATGSRLLSGNHAIFAQFEARIAKDKGTEAALIFNTGYQANVSVLSSLLDARVLQQRPLVFFDRLNHASLYQAVWQHNAELLRYRHLDMHHLAELLQQWRTSKQPKFIVTETVFGMDGDQVCVDTLAALTREHDALLYLDEAHAVGLWGQQAYGLSTRINAHDTRHVAMGTMSKALGCVGAYVACPGVIKDYLINKCPGFIYSTANAPMLIGSAQQAWTMIPTFDAARAALFMRARQLRERLFALGFRVELSSSPIIPVPIDVSRLQVTHQHLGAQGMRVSLIRPPTVPPHGQRLRIALNITHTDADVERLLQGFADATH